MMDTENDMTQLIREFSSTDADCEAVVEIHNMLWPEYLGSTKGMRANDANRDPAFYFQRLMWEEDGKVVAYASFGESAWSHKPGKYFIYIQVPPDHQRRGIGSAFYDHIMEVLAKRENHPQKLVSDTREDMEEYIRFLTKRGFKQTQRQEVSRLDVAGFDWEAFAGYRGRAQSHGLAIATVVELSKTDPEYKRKLYDLVWEILKDVPMPDPLTRRPYDLWIKQFDHPAFFPESWFIATDGDDYVGMSSLWLALADQNRLDVGLTGMLRPYRRKGIATELKVHTIELARDRNVRYLTTDNEENNPMYDLNVKLGFARMPGWLNFANELNREKAETGT